MITLEQLPQIEGGTDKQKMFADSVRLNFIIHVEQNFDQQLQKEALLVLFTRLNYRWWIDRSNKVSRTQDVKRMIGGAKAAITRAGSVEAAVEAQRKAIENSRNAWLNSRPLGGILDNIHRKI